MYTINQQISNLNRLMERKGFVGTFLCNAAHPGRLNESLTKHLLENWRNDAFIPTFNLITYSLSKSSPGSYLRCDFTVTHNHNEGFSISKMQIHQASMDHKLKSIELNINRNNEVPHRDKAYALVNPVEKKKNRKLGL